MEILMEKEAEDFLEREKFPVVKRELISNKKELVNALRLLKLPVTLKVTNKLHKTEVSGVKADLRNLNEVFIAYEKLKKISSRLLIQKFIPGTELLVGLKKDPTFNHILVFGSGGIYTELLKDISIKICPLTPNEIKEMIKETKIYNLITSRNKKINIGLLEKILLKTSKLAEKYRNIKELDINPLIINEKQAVIVDARIIFD